MNTVVGNNIQGTPGSFGGIDESDINKLPVINESIEDVTATTHQYILQHYLWQTVLLIAGSIALTALLIRFVGGALEEYTLLPLAAPFAAYGWLRDKVQGVFMRQFAHANAFRYQRHAPHQISEEGSIFNQPGLCKNKKMYNVVEGLFLKYPLRLFNYQYTIGSGRNIQTLKYTVLKLVLAANLPRIYLDTGSWASGERAPGWATQNLKRITTESNDFNKHFSLWAEEGHHLEALQIFTPDLMDELLRLPGKFDLEIIGSQVYIYDGGIIKTKRRLLEMFRLAKHLIENAGHVLERMRIA